MSVFYNSVGRHIISLITDIIKCVCWKLRSSIIMSQIDLKTDLDYKGPFC